MSKSLLIARRELQAYFSTWMGYVILAISLFINGILFNAYAIGDVPKFSATVLYDFFFFASGISMVAGLFLAMRLIAEEKQSGTLLLYFTSPVSERQIIYGKFLSALIFSVIIQTLTLYLPALLTVHGKISLGHLASGFLVLNLLGACSIAMALFASCISPSQVIAAVLGAVLLVTFLVLWMLADVVDQPFRDLFSYLAIHNAHFTAMAKGILHSKDLIFYLSFVIFFLECTVKSLEMRRWQG